MKHRVKGSLLWLLLAMVTALDILFYQSLSWHYEMQGEVTDLSRLPIESSGYEVDRSVRWYMRAAVREKASP